MENRKDLEQEIERCRRYVKQFYSGIDEWEKRAQELEDRLKALPPEPEEVDLSPWKPKGVESYFFIRATGVVSSGPVEIGHESSDCNYYRTKEEAEAAAKYLRLCARLYQMYVKLYGVKGWGPVGLSDNDECMIIRRNNSTISWCKVYGNNLDVTGLPFKTQADAKQVLAKLLKEGLA